MTRRLPLLGWLLAGVAITALVFGAALAAHAEGDDGEGARTDKDYVSRLTAEELAQLKQRLPKSWDEYSDAERQRIAKGVLRLRDMTPEQKKALEEKIRRYREAKRDDPELREKLKSRFDGVRDHRSPGRTVIRELHDVAKATGVVAADELDEGTIKRWQRWGIRQHRMAMPFFRLMVEEAVKPYADGEPMDLTRVPEGQREQFAGLTDDGGAKNRARLAHMYVATVSRGVVDRVPKPLSTSVKGQSPSSAERAAFGDAMKRYYHALGTAVKALWPAAFESAIARVKAIESGDDAWGFIERYGEPRDRGSRDTYRARMLVRALLEAPKLVKSPEEKAEVALLSNGLLRFFLIRKLGIDEAEVNTALAVEHPGERGQAVQRLMQAKGFKGGPRGGPHGDQPRRNKDDDGKKREGAGRRR